jgi:4a-hydroxytetrahydrobiopterin dehydratase
MGSLIEKKCTPCMKGAAPLKGETLKPLVAELGEGWKIIEEHHLEKAFSFENFKKALQFTDVIGRIAEEEGHHPDIHLSWGRVKVQIWTHKIDGLSENDFILAAKIDAEFISHEG